MPWSRMGESMYSSTILDVDTDGGYLSASRPSRFTPGDSAPSTHCIGGWVGPRTGLDTVKKINFSYPAGNLTPAIQPVAVPTELSRLPK
jgi:hypothetical protein